MNYQKLEKIKYYIGKYKDATITLAQEEELSVLINEYTSMMIDELGVIKAVKETEELWNFYLQLFADHQLKESSRR
jgi:hypothetical protein